MCRVLLGISGLRLGPRFDAGFSLRVFNIEARRINYTIPEGPGFYCTMIMYPKPNSSY